MRKFKLIILIWIIFIFCQYLIGDDKKENVLTLKDAIDIALKEHPKIKSAEAKINIYGEILHRANVSFLPDVDIGFKYDRLSYVTQQKARFLGSSLNDYQAFVTVRQPIFTGLKNISEKNAAYYMYEAAQVDYQVVSAEIKYDVKRKFYYCIYLNNLLNYKQELLKRAKDFYNENETLNRRRNIPRIEILLKIKVQYNNFKIDYINFKQKYETALNDLLTYLNIKNKDIKLLNEKTELKNITEDELDILKSPYYKSAINKSLSANEKVNAARALYFPQIGAYYTYRYEWPELPGGASDQIAGIYIDLPFFDWGITGSKFTEAQKISEDVKANEELIKRNIETELWTAYSTYKTCLEKLPLSEENMKSALKSLNIYEARYKNALSSIDEVLDSQKILASVQVDYETILLELYNSGFVIEKILGE